MAIAPKQVTSLQQTIAPRLPSSPIEIDQRFMDEFIRILRLYFNQIDNVTGGILTQTGGAYLHFPYGSFQSSVDQTIGAVNTPQLVTFNSSPYVNGISLESTNQIHANSSGLYLYNYSLQLANTDAVAPHNTQIWLKKNGTNISNTATKVDVPAAHGVVDGYLNATGAFFISLNAGDYIELAVATDSTSIYMEAYAVQTVPYARPAIPSAEATLSFVSSIQG
jgi:hypothetical protein